MAAEGAAVTVGRYVRICVLNCSLFIVNCSLPKAGAKIGKLLDRGVAGIFGTTISAVCGSSCRKRISS